MRILWWCLQHTKCTLLTCHTWTPIFHQWALRKKVIYSLILFEFRTDFRTLTTHVRQLLRYYIRWRTEILLPTSSGCGSQTHILMQLMNQLNGLVTQKNRQQLLRKHSEMENDMLVWPIIRLTWKNVCRFWTRTPAREDLWDGLSIAKVMRRFVTLFYIRHTSKHTIRLSTEKCEPNFLSIEKLIGRRSIFLLFFSKTQAFLHTLRFRVLA